MIARFSPISDQLALSGAIVLAPDQQKINDPTTIATPIMFTTLSIA